MICGAVGKMEHHEALGVRVASQEGTLVQALGAGGCGQWHWQGEW